MDSLITQLGVGGILAVLMVREVLSFLSKKGINGGKDAGARSDQSVRLLKEILDLIKEVHEWTRDLHVWHDVSDNDGVKLWYVRSSLEKAVVAMTQAIGTLSSQLAKLDVKSDSQIDLLREMKDEIRERRIQQ